MTTMEPITIEKKLYLPVGILLGLIITTMNFDKIRLNKTIELAYNISDIGKLICLFSVIISLIIYFILAILSYKTSKKLSILYIVITFMAVILSSIFNFSTIVFFLALVSVITSTANITVSIIEGKQKEASS